MGHKDSNYFLYHVSQKDLWLSRGFDGGAFSTDGQWFTGDLLNKAMFDDGDFDADALPEYMKKLGIKSCCLTFEMVTALVATIASEEGASDGWQPKQVSGE